MNHSRLLSRLAAAAALVLMARIAFGVEPELPDHGHVALPVDESFTLAAAVDAALANYPATLQLEARANMADAWVDRGSSWIAERPSLMLRYQTDRWGTDRGLTEYEAGIQLPLWNWGARSASRDLGDALSVEASTAGLALRWEVAGHVRNLLWHIALAENDHELAEQALDTATRLAISVERRYELGDVALSDVLLASSARLEAQTVLIEANAVLLDAERAYRSVTGLERRPAFLAESLSEHQEVEVDHPALAFSNAEVVRAEANLAVTEHTAKTGTSILVGARSERVAYAIDPDDSIGIVVTVPFGGSSHRKTEISEAVAVAASAKARRKQRQRDLSLALHEAAHGLDVVHQNLGAAQERLQFAERHQAMGEIAYEKGEFELIDLLKVQATVIAARRQVTRLSIDKKRQTALYNQAAGKLP